MHAREFQPATPGGAWLPRMSYCGDSALADDIQQRVSTVFRQTIELAEEGRKDETLLGCDFILRLESRFEPARRLQQQTLSNAPIDAADLRLLADLDDAFKPEAKKVMEFRRSVRVPLCRPYRVDVGSGWEYHLRGGLFEPVASDLAEGGLFVKVDSPKMQRSEIDFEVQFAGMGLIAGRGEVAWVCDPGSQPDHSPGMGIRFLDLHRDSEQVVRFTMESASGLKSAPPGRRLSIRQRMQLCG